MKNILQKLRKLLRWIRILLAAIRITVKTFAVRYFSGNKKIIYFIATPIYDNLGDQAIVNAQMLLFQDLGLKQNIVEITRYQYENLKGYLQKLIHKKDLIIIDGGGNMGTLWLEEEKKMRDIIARFSENPIFIFPQTAYFENTAHGQEELKKSSQIYNMHKNLTVFCRDMQTYELMKTIFDKVNAYYTPDIVLYTMYSGHETVRENVLLCLRNDLEQVHNENIEDTIKTYFAQNDVAVKVTSTMSSERLNRHTRKGLLEKKWKEFGTARLVVTDRLHGMIFCAITGTPCIALDNKSHKVGQGYEWIKYLPYIRFCNYDEDIIKVVQELYPQTEKVYRYDRSPLEPYYDTIKKEVKNAFFN